MKDKHFKLSSLIIVANCSQAAPDNLSTPAKHTLGLKFQ